MLVHYGSKLFFSYGMINTYTTGSEGEFMVSGFYGIIKAYTAFECIQWP